MIPIAGPLKPSPTLTTGVGPTMVSSRKIRSGLKSPAVTTTPPRAVRWLALTPLSPTTDTSPKPLVGPVAMASLICTLMASRLS